MMRAQIDNTKARDCRRRCMLQVRRSKKHTISWPQLDLLATRQNQHTVVIHQRVQLRPLLRTRDQGREISTVNNKPCRPLSRYCAAQSTGESTVVPLAIAKLTVELGRRHGRHVALHGDDLSSCLGCLLCSDSKDEVLLGGHHWQAYTTMPRSHGPRNPRAHC